MGLDAVLSTEQTFYVGVKWAIFYNNHLLIVQETPSGWWQGWWELPGGKISKDEAWASLNTTLIREISEEIGVCIDENNITGLLGMYKFPQPSHSEHGLILPVFEIQLTHPVNIILSKEHINIDWITESDIDAHENWK